MIADIAAPKTPLRDPSDECQCGRCHGSRQMDADDARRSSHPVIHASGRVRWPDVGPIDGEGPGHVGEGE